jgi:hypothetical protein
VPQRCVCGMSNLEAIYGMQHGCPACRAYVHRRMGLMDTALNNPYVIRGESFDTTKLRYFYGQAVMQPWIDPKTNQPGFKRVLLVYRIPLFEFTNDTVSPLTFVTTEGLQLRPYRHFITDGGSIPRFLWAVPFVRLGPWDFPRAYPFHDSGFTYGGLYVLEGGKWRFKMMKRTRLNRLLGDMIRADGGSSLDEVTVEAGLAVGSTFAWDPVRQVENRLRDGVVVDGELV